MSRYKTLRHLRTNPGFRLRISRADYRGHDDDESVSIPGSYNRHRGSTPTKSDDPLRARGARGSHSEKLHLQKSKCTRWTVLPARRAVSRSPRKFQPPHRHAPGASTSLRQLRALYFFEFKRSRFSRAIRRLRAARRVAKGAAAFKDGSKATVI